MDGLELRCRTRLSLAQMEVAPFGNVAPHAALPVVDAAMLSAFQKGEDWSCERGLGCGSEAGLQRVEGEGGLPGPLARWRVGEVRGGGGDCDLYEGMRTSPQWICAQSYPPYAAFWGLKFIPRIKAEPCDEAVKIAEPIEGAVRDLGALRVLLRHHAPAAKPSGR